VNTGVILDTGRVGKKHCHAMLFANMTREHGCSGPCPRPK